MFAFHTTPENLIPGALLHGRLDAPDGAPVHGRLDADGAVYLYTSCTMHGYVLKDLTALAAQGHSGVGAAGPYHYTGIAAIVAWAQDKRQPTDAQLCAGTGKAGE